jgi:hypothetical protein
MVWLPPLFQELKIGNPKGFKPFANTLLTTIDKVFIVTGKAFRLFNALSKPVIELIKNSLNKRRTVARVFNKCFVVSSRHFHTFPH